jgi:hypothetical protein
LLIQRQSPIQRAKKKEKKKKGRRFQERVCGCNGWFYRRTGWLAYQAHEDEEAGQKKKKKKKLMKKKAGESLSRRQALAIRSCPSRADECR